MSRTIARQLLCILAPTALAGTALLISLLPGQRQVAALVSAVALAAVIWAGRSLATGPAQLAPRLILAAAAASWAATGGVAEARTTLAGPDWPALLAGMVLVGLLSIEAPLFRVGRPLYRVANLPGVHRRHERLLDRRLAAAANTLTLATLILFGLAGWSGWPLLVAAGGAASVTVATGLAAAWRRLPGRGRMLARLRQAVTGYAPAFMVYFTAPPGSTYQLTMWLPHLEQLNERFVVVLREPGAFGAVARATGAPVLYVPELRTFDGCVVPSVKAVFYVNNGARNTHCVRYGTLTHIFLNHGDSDKLSSANPVTAMYDRVFVAGQAGIDRYHQQGVEIPRHKFRIVGRPQVAQVRPPRLPLDQVDEPVVLYAPTWAGHHADASYSSLPVAAAIVTALLSHGVTVILRHHPYSLRSRGDAARLAAAHRLLATDAARTGRQHRWGAAATTEMSLVDCFNASDAMVCDVSSVASEYLFSGKPFAITDMAGDADAFLEAFPLARVAYVIDQRAANLADVLHRLLKSDPKRPERLQTRTHYLGDIPRDQYADRFVTEARRYL